jgi:hypothetical protein
MLARGIVAHLSCVDTRVLAPEWAGRSLDAATLTELQQLAEREGFDACGEQGEYHTMVTDGPGFAAPLTLGHWQVRSGQVARIGRSTSRSGNIAGCGPGAWAVAIVQTSPGLAPHLWAERPSRSMRWSPVLLDVASGPAQVDRRAVFDELSCPTHPFSRLRQRGKFFGACFGGTRMASRSKWYDGERTKWKTNSWRHANRSRTEVGMGLVLLQITRLRTSQPSSASASSSRSGVSKSPLRGTPQDDPVENPSAMLSQNEPLGLSTRASSRLTSTSRSTNSVTDVSVPISPAPAP